MNEQDGQEATAMLASQMAANQSQSQRSEVQPQGERRDNTPSIANNVTKPTNQQPRKGGPPRNMFPDKQQIFVGCLPKSVEENQLKELFQSMFIILMFAQLLNRQSSLFCYESHRYVIRLPPEVYSRLFSLIL